MNERIKELAKEAGITTNLDTDYFVNDPDSSLKTLSNAGKWVDYFSEKFAEMLIRECVDILSQNNPCPPGSTIMYSLIQDEYFDKGWQVAVETKSNQIKKHFGVQE